MEDCHKWTVVENSKCKGIIAKYLQLLVSLIGDVRMKMTGVVYCVDACVSEAERETGFIESKSTQRLSRKWTRPFHRSNATNRTFNGFTVNDQQLLTKGERCRGKRQPIWMQHQRKSHQQRRTDRSKLIWLFSRFSDWFFTSSSSSLCFRVPNKPFELDFGSPFPSFMNNFEIVRIFHHPGKEMSCVCLFEQKTKGKHLRRNEKKAKTNRDRKRQKTNGEKFFHMKENQLFIRQNSSQTLFYDHFSLILPVGSINIFISVQYAINMPVCVAVVTFRYGSDGGVPPPFWIYEHHYYMSTIRERSFARLLVCSLARSLCAPFFPRLNIHFVT